jgi:hypothetical protein
MTFYQLGRRVMRWRTYIFVAIIAFGAFMGVYGGAILKRFVRPCNAAPAYHADVPQALRDQLGALHARGLLYCSAPMAGLVSTNSPVYWGSDGISSVLFFQADRMDDLGVVRYGFGQSVQSAFTPVTAGAGPIDGVREDAAGRPAITNQAPPGATYFYRLQGAPATNDSVVAVTVRGTARPQPGVSGRDAFRDLEMLWNIVRGRPRTEIEETTAQVSIPILPEEWLGAGRRDTNPSLADDQGQLSAKAIRAAAPRTPELAQTVSGVLGTTIWVAGVMSDTTPALVLVPQGDAAVGVTPPPTQAGGTATTSTATAVPAAPATGVITPTAQAGWVVMASDEYLEHFAFPPLPSGARYEARYWHDGKQQAAKPADYVWNVAVP